MERLLALWVEGLSSDTDDGATMRDTIALLDALLILCPFTEVVRRGLFVMPVRGPSRFMGGDEAVLDAVRSTLSDVVGMPGQLGIAEGLFCAELAAKEGIVVAVGHSDLYRRRQPLSALGRKDLVTIGQRLGLRTLGGFADLPRARVAERFDKEAVILHRVASGELDALPGQRDLGLQKKMKRIRGEYTGSDEQLGFFGQRGAADERADQAALRVRRRLGPEGVLLAVLRGGRAPQDRATLVPWGSPPSKNLSAAPWPGLHQAPSPASTFAQPVSVKLTDGEGRDVLVGARGGLSATPARLSFHSTQHLPVTWFAGPWPLVERWWEKGRRRVHVQILLESGQALLLCAEEGQWWLVGMYD